MNNQECKIRPEVIDFNSDCPLFCPYSITVNKCSSSFNNINNPYAKLCVPDVIKNINIKVFNLMSNINVIQNGMKLVNANVNQMQMFVITNNVGIMIDVDVNVKNLLTKEDAKKDLFEIQVFVNVNVINRVTLVNIQTIKIANVEKDQLINLWKNVVKILMKIEIIYNATLNDHIKVCHSCTIYITLLPIFFIISISISRAFIYFHWYLKKDNTYVNTSIKTETSIYQTHKWEV